MAKYDYGGGCPCGWNAECEPGCANYAADQLRVSQEKEAAARYRASLKTSRKVAMEKRNSARVPLETLQDILEGAEVDADDVRKMATELLSFRVKALSETLKKYTT